MSDPTHEPELSQFESALRGLSPSTGTLTREMLMFRAGQSSVSCPRWPWQAATGLMALTAIGLVVAWRLQLAPAPVEHTRYVDREVRVFVTSPAPNPAEVAPTPSALSDELRPRRAYYLEDRDLALRFGVESLPPSETSAPETTGGRIESRDDLRAGSTTLLGTSATIGN